MTLIQPTKSLCLFGGVGFLLSVLVGVKMEPNVTVASLNALVERGPEVVVDGVVDVVDDCWCLLLVAARCFWAPFDDMVGQETKLVVCCVGSGDRQWRIQSIMR